MMQLQVQRPAAGRCLLVLRLLLWLLVLLP
jgi:hypothetical protein